MTKKWTLQFLDALYNSIDISNHVQKQKKKKEYKQYLLQHMIQTLLFTFKELLFMLMTLYTTHFVQSIITIIHVKCAIIQYIN
jgi:uncharacterized protein (DUF2336 family)